MKSIYRNIIFILFLTVSCTSESGNKEAKKVDTSHPNYDYVIGEWKIIDYTAYDPEKKILKTKEDSLKFESTIKDMKKYNFRFYEDLTLDDPTADKPASYYFVQRKIPDFFGLKWKDGMLYINESPVLFNIISKDTMQLAWLYAGNKAMATITFLRID